MKTVGIFLLLLVLVVMSIIIVQLISNLEQERGKGKIVERIVDTVQTEEQFQYYTGLALNEQVWNIMSSGGYQDIIKFFNEYTKRADISTVLIEETLNLGVPIVDGFALAYGENTRFNPKLVNKNPNGTRDWGLMQLNDGHRKDWKESDFFNIKKNVHESMSYFKGCLEEYDYKFLLARCAYSGGMHGIYDGISFNILANLQMTTDFHRELEVQLNYLVNRWKPKDNEAKQ